MLRLAADHGVNPKFAVDARFAADHGAPASPPPFASSSASPLEAALRAEREQRSVLEARLRAQRTVTLRLRDENETLAAQLATTTQRLRSTARTRDEMRCSLEETDALDVRVRGALARKQEAASAAMSRALKTRVRELEGELSELRPVAGPVNGPASQTRLASATGGRRVEWDYD